LFAVPRLYAADTADTGGLAEVVVNRTKARREPAGRAPSVSPRSASEKLEQLGVQNFDDYVKYLPSVAYQSGGPGFARVFMRGVSSGDNGNHSGPLPSVGVYLDEQRSPASRRARYARVRHRAGRSARRSARHALRRQFRGGTVRIITNKPDLTGFKAGYDLQGDTVRGQGGYVAEGFVNLPLSPMRDPLGWLGGARRWLYRQYPARNFIYRPPGSASPTPARHPPGV